MSEHLLFSEFSPVDAKSWKQKIQADLKGADYNETLIWESPEGIKIKPFYTSVDRGEIEEIVDQHESKWLIGQWIKVDDEDNAINQCKVAIANGVENLILRITSDNLSPTSFLNNLELNGRTVYLDLRELPMDIIGEWVDSVTSMDEQIQLIWDPINQLSANGNWYANREKDLQKFREVNLEDQGILAVDISLYQNAGANRVQQLAYALAHTQEYLDLLAAEQRPKPVFLVSVDTNYFFEIAKIRALRLLWDKLSKQSGEATACEILAYPTRRNKTLYDYNVNMLRTTTECMAAILGGADTVYNLPYDNIYHHGNAFAERIARNQLLILKNESYLDKVSNVASGAYYIESLTKEMADKAWRLYQQIQDGGGWLAQLKEHKIQKKIKESAQKQQAEFDQGREVLVGSNKYPNEADQMKDQIEKDPFLKKEQKKTLIEPILEKRLAETLEKNRLEDE